MFFHLKTAVAILFITGALGVAVNAMRTTTKIVPENFIKSKERAPAPAPVDTATTGPTVQPADPNVVVLEDVRKAFASGLAYFIDARKPEQFAQGHIKGSINLPSTALWENITTVTTNVPLTELVIIYCDGGNCEASHTVADALRTQGYINVKVYVKGWEELEKASDFAEMAEVSP